MLSLTIEGLKATASLVAGRVSLFVVSHAPELMTGAGIIGLVTAGVAGAKASYDLHDILAEHNNLRALIKNTKEESTEEQYPDKQYNDELRKERISRWISIGKLYAGPVILGGISVATIIGGQAILNQRTLALGAAYKGLKQAYDSYRESVKDFHKSNGGDPEEFDALHKVGAYEQTVRTVVTDEDGKSKKEPEKFLRFNPEDFKGSIFEFSEETSIFHRPTYESNLFFAQTQENAANYLLRKKGHLFLNDVLQLLGLKTIPTGQILGWFYDPSDPKRDCAVSFDLDAPYNSHANATTMGEEHSIIVLDFNYDGPIINLI